MPGTKKRVPLFDDQGARIRGKLSKEAAEVALAKERISRASDDEDVMLGNGQSLVARVCSDYIQYCEQGLAKGALSIVREISVASCRAQIRSSKSALFQIQ